MRAQPPSALACLHVRVYGARHINCASEGTYFVSTHVVGIADTVRHTPTATGVDSVEWPKHASFEIPVDSHWICHAATSGSPATVPAAAQVSSSPIPAPVSARPVTSASPPLVPRRGSRPIRLRRSSLEKPVHEIPEVLSAPGMLSLEFVLWRKRTEHEDLTYLGECTLRAPSWALNFAPQEDRSAVSEPRWLTLTDSNAVTGELCVDACLERVPGAAATPDELYSAICARSAVPTIQNFPATQSVGTSRNGDFEDDGLNSETEAADSPWIPGLDDDDDVSDIDLRDGNDTFTGRMQELAVDDAGEVDGVEEGDQNAGMSASHRRRFLHLSRNALMRRHRHSHGSPEALDTLYKGPLRQRISRRRFRRKFGADAKRDFAFDSALGKEVIGIVMVEVVGAHHLPRWMNLLNTTFDMDPFTIVSFSRKVFRTRVCRHTLNPEWNEKLLFHVHSSETSYPINFVVFDWDNITEHDYVGEASLQVSDLIESSTRPDERGLYPDDERPTDTLDTFELPLSRQTRDEDIKFGQGPQPHLVLRATYTPYDKLRQRFWREMARIYDTNESGGVELLELQLMLRSLGSTLTDHTLREFFYKLGYDPEVDSLTYDEVVLVLEDQLHRPVTERRVLDDSDTDTDSAANSPVLNPRSPPSGTEKVEENHHNILRFASAIASGERALQTHSQAQPNFECVITLSSCPMCNMPRLSKIAERDILTHLAVCASRDWRRVNDMSVSNFVTTSQAQRKWFTNVVKKISQGHYRAGANSANILVHSRRTGQLVEEKMQVYVRLGIRLLYQGAQSRMAGARARRMLHNMTIKQGAKYDHPSSVHAIVPFMQFHGIHADEFVDKIESFRTFNEFFCRKIMLDRRPIADRDDPRTLVSCADCRLIVFQSVEQATQLWIKGRDFSIVRLLGDRYAKERPQSETPAVLVFRLAPQDYHRFHAPVDGVVGEPHWISGEYYTVNPMAIRSTIDVYGENTRVVIPIYTEHFGTVYAVAIGAMMVASIVLSVEAGAHIRRGEELGYFKFGGSTVVLILDTARVQLDQDLLVNSESCVETLVEMGMRVGRARS